MSNQKPSPETLLAAALEISGAAERRAYLDHACGGDAALRQEVESLLDANAAAGEFLLHPAAIGAGAAETTMLIPPLSELTGTRIGHYKLLEQIGEGGFGVVWMAEQEEPVRRRVALKVIKLGMDTREVVARFEAERQALAMMDHPNIARVFDGGATDTGRPYFVMELVKGVPITDYCDANKLSTRERLELFMQVCHAVQHAHQKGIIHRDLKPTNILVTVQDDRPVPKVIDFGVAKATQARLTEKTVFTRFHQWIGTPAYMSPEQAGLGSLDVDTRSDIYSLGVLLYELLTGRPPFDTQKLLAAGYDAVMRTIREEEPPKPSTRLSTLAKEELNTVAAKRGADPARLNRLVRGDLDWIVMKALEKDRTRRYETANAFARDVEAYLEQEPVNAAAPSVAYRARRFIGRNRLVVGFSTALALALVIGTIISTWQAVRAKQASREADTQRVAATNEAARALRLAQESARARHQVEAGAYASQVLLASQRLAVGDLSEADRLLEACTAPLRNWEWHYLKRQSQPTCQVLQDQTNEVWSVAASPDGRWLASLDRDGRLLLWDLKGNLSQPTQLWPAEGRRGWTPDVPVSKALAFSHDSRSLAVARPVGQREWGLGLLSIGTTNAPQERLRIKDELGPLCFSFSPDDRRLMVGCPDGVMRSYDVASGQEAASYEIMAAAFSRDGSRVASMGVTPRRWRETETEHKLVRVIKVFDTSNGRELLAITNLSEPPTLFSLALSPDGERVAAGFVEMTTEVRDDESGIYDIEQAERGWTVVWDVSTHKELLRQRLTASGPGDLAFSDDGKHLAIASSSFRFLVVNGGDVGGVIHTPTPGKVLIMDVMSGEEVISLRGHLHDVTGVAFMDRGRRLASASSDHTVRLWDLGASRIIPLGRRRPEHTSDDPPPSSLSSDGRMIAVPITDRVCDVVNLVTGRTLASARVPEPERILSAALACSPPGLACLSGTTLHYWDLASGRKTWSFSTTNLGPGAEGIVMSPDGRRVALGFSLKAIVKHIDLLDAGSGKPIIQTNSPYWGVAFSPDSRLLLAGDFDGNVHIWDAVDGGEVLCRRAIDSRPGASLRDLFVEDLDSPLDEIRRETMGIPVTCLAVSPDGSQFATAAGLLAAELRLWDMASGQPKWAKPIASMARAITFSPDGRRLAVACAGPFGTGSDLAMLDAVSGQELVHLPSNAGITSLSFSPDSARLWGVTLNGMLVFWEASPWSGPVTPPAVALKPSVVDNPERKSTTRP
jgi:serine/threonine protein kinase/WD40 repeat protein